MKKILITLFQLSVTIAVLYWVYHDPNRRAQMAEAIRGAQYHWVVTRHPCIRCGGSCRGVSLACSAEGPREFI